MNSLDEYPEATGAAAWLAAATGMASIDAVVVLGSGWTPAVAALGTHLARLPMAEVPGFLAPVAPGHPGEIVVTDLSGLRVMACLGRTHVYEGHGLTPVVHAVRTAAAWGARVGILTNANGSFRPDWPIGTGMLIDDHIYAAGPSPLSAPTELNTCWSPRLRTLAAINDPDLTHGVYLMTPGPHFETRAEAHMFATIGADVVGMSTVPEAIAAHALGMELLGISIVTAFEFADEGIDPDAVVAAAEATAGRLGDTIAAVLTAT